MEKENQKPLLIVFHESVLRSWLKDVWTFGTFVVVLGINYFLFDNGKVAAFFLIIFWLIWLIARVKGSKKFYSKEKAIDFLKNLN